MSDLATAGRLRQATHAVPAFPGIAIRVCSKPSGASARARARLRRPRAHGAQCRRLPGARRARRRADARPQRRRRRAPVQRLPPSAGADAQRARQRASIVCPMHRWTYDLKGELLGAPHFADKPCLEPRAHAAAELERPAVRRPARRRAATWPRSASSTSTSRATCSTASRLHRVQLQLEILHRGLPRGLPRRPVPSRPRPVRHRATT